MKNYFYIAIAAMMALSSCSENEIATDNEIAKTPITIDVYQQGQTRVTETNITTLQRSGFDLFVMTNEGEELINNKATFTNNKWSYGTTTVYWPTNIDTSLSFYGLYSPNANDAMDVENDLITINVDGTSDVVVANENTSKPTDGVVTLSFKHVNAEVVVSAKGQDPDLTYTVTKVIFNVPSVVDYYISDFTTMAQETAIPKNLTFYQNATGIRTPYSATTYTAIADANMLILPACQIDVIIDYTVASSNGDSETFTDKTATITPVAGQVNRINLNLPSGRTPITFTVAVDPWTTTANNINDPTLQ